MSLVAEILVIDDSATVRKLVELSMRGSPFRPHFAHSGREGLQRARALRPAAILLDCVLPDVAGVEICRRLADDDRTRSIPILLITARSASARDEFQEFAAVVDFVGKPFTGPDLLARLGRVIGAPPAAAPRRFSRELQERAARILYGHLRDGLARIPSYMSQLGASPPAPYFARRLLARDVIDGLLGELLELCEDAMRTSTPAPASSPRDAEDPDADGLALAPTSVFDRAPGFGDRVRHADLGAAARRVLSLIDGTHTLADIHERSGIDMATVAETVRTLLASGLLIDRTVEPPRPRPIVILEPDVEGFQGPLASMLESRAEPARLIAVDELEEIIATARRVHPCLVLVNASCDRSAVGNTARRLRADATLGDVALVAVLDIHDHESSDELFSAGFDAVLSKPIIVGELDRFIAPVAAR